MSERRPDFDELVGGDVPAEDRARLERVHELLLEAGPPPELPPELEAPPEAPSRGLLPRRRRAALVLVAAALGAAVFGGGYLVGQDDATVEAVIPMVGVGSPARASLQVFEADDAGNWPMKLIVHGLPELPKGRHYELWLTKGDSTKVSCGTFVVRGRKTEVLLNAPYRLRDFDGWVVTSPPSNDPVLRTT